jgi:phosphatidylserine/phosphatidylglycerophosphate/cardiolipin synthase-like enzyme
MGVKRAGFGNHGGVTPRSWLLTGVERGNPYTRCRDWTTGNEVRPLIHGRTYFSELYQAIRATGRGDLILFTDWRGDPDERLDGPGSEIADALCRAAERGVVVKGLIWRSHLDRLFFSEAENRHLGEKIEAAGGQCVRDLRVRAGGSHHQKLVVVRHPARPEDDVAYVGGIDLCHGRRDDDRHGGDPQAVPMSGAYGQRPPWHDVQLAIRGPAVGDVEAAFRERWDDPTPVTRNPFYRLADALRRDDDRPEPLPPQRPDPPPCGPHTVQLLRTYPYRRFEGYPFAPYGERSVALGYAKALRHARHLVYLEDQYLWSAEVARTFADALAREPGLYLVAVVPRHPDQPGRLAEATEAVGRGAALSLLHKAGGDRVAVYSPENHAGTPVYVHAKVCVIDDAWLTVGSDNFNLRSWTHDSELTAAVIDDEGRLPGAVRRTLLREHLDRPDGDDADLVDPESTFAAVARSADELEKWYADGCVGPRPPGRLRRYRSPVVPRSTRTVAAALYRRFYDPDGRPRALRRRHAF